MSETTALAVRAPMDLTERIEALKKEKYNVLLPMTTFASQNELFVPRLDIVVPDIAAGDFYKQGTKKVGDNWVDVMAPSGQFLNKIASAANIQWHPDKCGHTVLESNRVVYKAVAAVRQADGQWRTLTDEYELDLEVVEAELRMEYKKKAKTEDFKKKMKKEGMELEDYIERDLLQKRRHKLALAASGAMNRVIRKALTLRSTYLVNEAKNPFAIARFDFQPDYNDPTVRRYASIAAIQAQNDLYGQGSAAIPEGTTQDEINEASQFMQNNINPNIEIIDGMPTNLETGEINPADLVLDAEIIPPSEENNEPPPEPDFICEECKKKLEDVKKRGGGVITVSQLVDASQQTGVLLCGTCIAKKMKEQQKAGDGK